MLDTLQTYSLLTGGQYNSLSQQILEMSKINSPSSQVITSKLRFFTYPEELTSEEEDSLLMAPT